MLTQVIRDAMGSTALDPRDAAAFELALVYARRLDGSVRCGDCGGKMDDLTKLGPALLAVLEALQLSPRARAAAKKAVTDVSGAGALDQLAARRSGRSRAPGVDTSAP